MSTLSKVAMQLMGLLTPKPSKGDAISVIDLPEPVTTGGRPLMEALTRRRSGREFQAKPLPYQTVSNLLWAAFGINRRPSQGRTAPSAMGCQEIDIYLALPSGAYCYEPHSHSLQLVVADDVRRVTGYQDFVDNAPLDLVYVANHSRMKMIPAAHRETYASASTGAISQNVYLYCASEGLSTVIRAWIAREALAEALQLRPEEQVLFSQTIGYPRVD